MLGMRAAGRRLRLAKFPTLNGNRFVQYYDHNLRNKKEIFIFLPRDSCMAIAKA